MTLLKKPIFRLSLGGYEFTLTLGWLITLLVTFPILTRLGLWQLDRAAQRQQAQDEFAKVKTLEPRSFTDIDFTTEDTRLVRVRFAGELDWSRQILLDNQVHNTVSGYEVLVPMIYQPGKAILVSRGWLPATPGKLPDLSVAQNSNSFQEITGLAVVPSARMSDYQREVLKQTKGYQAINKNPKQAIWPLVVQEEDFSGISSLLELELIPRVLQPEYDLAFGYRRIWQPSLRGPAVNYGYAAQWFGMIVLLLGLMVWFNTRRL